MDKTKCIFYQKPTNPLHQEHLIPQDIVHMVCDHCCGKCETKSVFSTISTASCPGSASNP